MSNCRVISTIRLPTMLASLALFFGACSLETEMRPVEKQQNASTGQTYESKAPLPSPTPGRSSASTDSLRRTPESARMGGAIMSPYPYPQPPYYPRPPVVIPNTDRFPDKEPTSVLSAAEHPVSTFSVDVDTASYAFVRRSLTGGRVPPRESFESRRWSIISLMPIPLLGSRAAVSRDDDGDAEPVERGEAAAAYRYSRLRHRAYRATARQRGALDRYLGLDAAERSPAFVAAGFSPVRPAIA